MKTASGCSIGARVSGTCQKLPVPANMELGDPGALGVGRGRGLVEVPESVGRGRGLVEVLENQRVCRRGGQARRNVGRGRWAGMALENQ